MKNLNIADLLKPFVKFIRRFHTILFFLLVSGSLFAAIIVLMSIISLSSSTSAVSDQAVNGSFDEATIDRIKNKSGSAAQPGSRSSPFVE